MRWMEIVVVVANIVILGWMIVQRNKTMKLLVLLSCASAVLSIAQLFGEGYRWQMVPVYGIPLMLLVYIWKLHKVSRGAEKGKNFSRVLMIVGIALYALIAAALPFVMPVFTFEAPTGPYAIGTATYHWVDSNREEIYTKDSGDHRELMVQLWYPTDQGGRGKPVSYLPDSERYRKAICKEFGLPDFVLSYMDLVKTHAIADMPVASAEKAYPVVIFSPSNGGTRFQNTFQAEELASHGYIVVGVEHTYHSLATAFPDGRIIGFYRMNMLNFQVMDQDMKQVIVKDIQFVLDEIEQLNRNDVSGRLTGKFDLNRIGMMGHSLGGAATTQMLLQDDRVKAGINMDGTFFGDVPKMGIKKPFMLMSSEDSEKSENEQPKQEQLDKYGFTRQQFDQIVMEGTARKKNALANGGYHVTLQHTVHYSYSDFYLYSPIVQWMDGVDPRRAHRIINDYTLAFFDQYLKGNPSPLLNAKANKDTRVLFKHYEE